MEFSYSQLTRDLLKVIRQERTYVEADLFFKLGKNQYRRWEKGISPIKWDDFVSLAKKAKLPLREALEETCGYKGSPFHYHEIIFACCGKSPYQTISANIGVSRYVVNRWIKGKASLTLSRMLQIIHVGTTRLPVFIRSLTGKNTPSSFRSYLEHTDSMLQLLQAQPWISGILTVLERKDYRLLPRHSDQWVAERSRLSITATRETLRALEEHGLIAKKQNHYQSTLKDIDPSVLKQKAKRLLLYWIERNTKAVETNYPSPTRRSLSSYQVFSVDEKSAEAVKALYVEFVKKVALVIVPNEGMGTESYSFVMSMVNFEDMTIEGK